jgi:hypothetical protein
MMFVISMLVLPIVDRLGTPSEEKPGRRGGGSPLTAPGLRRLTLAS